MPIIRGQFLVALHRIRCEGRLQNGIKLSDGLRLIDESSRIPAFKNRDFRGAVGDIELENMLKAKLYVISDEMEFELPDGTTGPQLVAYLLNVVRTYLFTLWLIKDNSAYFEQGYVIESGIKRIHSNLIVTAFSNHDGEYRDASFTTRELQHMRAFVNGTSLFGNTVANFHEASEKRMKLVSDKKVEVYDRFMRFITFARETRDLGLKIALCCSALETLLSHAAGSELTHKVSERVALLISPIGAERLKMFYDMKQLYSIRSTVVHGSQISKKYTHDIQSYSRQIDDIVRAVTAKLHEDQVFQEAAFSKDGPDDYFLK